MRKFLAALTLVASGLALTGCATHPAPAPTTTPSTLHDVAPSTTPTPTPTPTPTIETNRYAFGSATAPGYLMLLLKNGKTTTAYPSSQQNLHKSGKCVVNFFSTSVANYATEQQQVTSSNAIVQQFLTAVKGKGKTVKNSHILSEEKNPKTGDNYEVGVRYTTFTSTAVHGYIYARVFPNGVGFSLAVSCPSTVKLPKTDSIIKLRTGINS